MPGTRLTHGKQKGHLSERLGFSADPQMRDTGSLVQIGLVAGDRSLGKVARAFILQPNQILSDRLEVFDNAANVFHFVRSVRRLHPVTLEHLLACPAELGPVLLQTLLNCEIIRHLLSAEATCVSPAGCLLLWTAHVALREAG